jgi:hypothetical protein
VIALFISYFFPNILGAIIGLLTNIATMGILVVMVNHQFDEENKITITFDDYKSQIINVAVRLLGTTLLNILDSYQKHKVNILSFDSLTNPLNFNSLNHNLNL